MSLPERFELASTPRRLFLVAPWLGLAFVVLFAALPFLPGDGKPKNESFIVGLSLFGIVMFGVGALYSFRIVREIPGAAITVDNEGLWPTILPRQSAMVRWADIAKVRERPFLQRLELMGRDDEVRIRIEYQLHAFERLRAIVLERAVLERGFPEANGTYALPWWHHVRSIGSIVGFSLLGWYVGGTNPVPGYGGMAVVVVVISWEYWSLPYRIRLTDKTLEIAFPGRTQSVPKANVVDVQLTDEFRNQMRVPHVVIQLLPPAKAIQIKGLGLPSSDLYRALKSWRAGNA